MSDIELCEQCQHPFDPHALIATTGRPDDGGIMLCPQTGCSCFMTWGMEGGAAKQVPNEEEIDRLRQSVQQPTEATG